jgi:hypothetical protein
MVMPKKHPELPNVPLAIDYAKTDDSRRILKYAVHDIATLPAFISCRPQRRRIA